MKIKKDFFEPIDKDEEELIKAINNDEFVEIPDQEKEIKKYTLIFKKALKKEKRITIRVDKHDLKQIQNKAIESGIPYQTLISSILHKFARGKMQIGI